MANKETIEEFEIAQNIIRRFIHVFNQNPKLRDGGLWSGLYDDAVNYVSKNMKE